MGIKYKDDPHLEFLMFCENDDLSILVDFLTKSKIDKLRLTERLTSEKRFKECNEKFSEIWDLIAGELQLFGADSIVSLIRGGKGVLYRKILIDVCKKLKVDINSKSEVGKIETKLLMKIVEDSFEKMNEEEKREFAKNFNINVANLSTVAFMAALQTAIHAGGFATYKLAVIVANAAARNILGRGLSLAGNAVLVRGISILAGPIGWAISVILTLPMITGPAYRVTIPSVIQIAYMRQKYINKEII